VLFDHKICGRHVRDPLPAIFLQASFQQQPNRFGSIRGQGTPIGIDLQSVRECVADIFTLEYTLAGEHFVQDATERPYIGALVGIAAPCLFRRHVGRRSENHSRLSRSDRQCGRIAHIARRTCLERLGETEIEHLYLTLARERNIARLEIAVNDSFLVRGLQCVGDLPRNVERLIDRKRSTLQPLG